MMKFFLKEIQDLYAQANFEMIKDFIKSQIILRFQWTFVAFETDVAVTNKKIRHSLGFVPKDLIETFKTGAGTITYNYDNFDTEFIDLTTTGPCKVRFLIGLFKEGSAV